MLMMFLVGSYSIFTLFIVCAFNVLGKEVERMRSCHPFEESLTIAGSFVGGGAGGQDTERSLSRVEGIVCLG